MNLRQSSFSCKPAKLLPEIKESSGEKRVSQNLEQEGTLVCLMIDKGAVLSFICFFFVSFFPCDLMTIFSLIFRFLSFLFVCYVILFVLARRFIYGYIFDYFKFLIS